MNNKTIGRNWKKILTIIVVLIFVSVTILEVEHSGIKRETDLGDGKIQLYFGSPVGYNYPTFNQVHSNSTCRNSIGVNYLNSTMKGVLDLLIGHSFSFITFNIHVTDSQKQPVGLKIFSSNHLILPVVISPEEVKKSTLDHSASISAGNDYSSTDGFSGYHIGLTIENSLAGNYTFCISIIPEVPSGVNLTKCELSPSIVVYQNQYLYNKISISSHYVSILRGSICNYNGSLKSNLNRIYLCNTNTSVICKANLQDSCSPNRYTFILQNHDQYKLMYIENSEIRSVGCIPWNKVLPGNLICRNINISKFL